MNVYLATFWKLYLGKLIKLAKNFGDTNEISQKQSGRKTRRIESIESIHFLSHLSLTAQFNHAYLLNSFPSELNRFSNCVKIVGKAWFLQPLISKSSKAISESQTSSRHLIKAYTYCTTSPLKIWKPEGCFDKLILHRAKTVLGFDAEFRRHFYECTHKNWCFYFRNEKIASNSLNQWRLQNLVCCVCW